MQCSIMVIIVLLQHLREFARYTEVPVNSGNQRRYMKLSKVTLLDILQTFPWLHDLPICGSGSQRINYA